MVFDLVLVTGLFLSLGVEAQTTKTQFTSIAPEELGSKFIRCIYKDSRGFMWFGTGTGLIRFDGTNVYRYERRPNDSKSIPNNRINAITEDSDKNLWIGTGHGLVRYDNDKDAFIDVDSVDGAVNHLSNKYVAALCTDKQGNLWIGTHGNGLNVYNPKTLTFTYLADTSYRLRVSPDDYITSLFLARDNIWVSTKGGLKLYSTKTMLPLSLSVDDVNVKSKEITQVIQDQSENVWLATADRQIIRLSSAGGGYHVRKTKLKRNSVGGDEGSILTLVADVTDNLWMGGENSGLNYLDSESLAITSYLADEENSKKLPTNSVRCVYVDNKGLVWIGTYNRGVFLIDHHAKKFETFQRNTIAKNGLTGNNIRGLAEDKKGNIWFASSGAGLGKLDLNNFELQFDETINRKLATGNLSALLCDSEGNLWIGTWGSGVYKLNLTTHSLTRYTQVSGGFGDNKVFCVYEDKKKNIWVGTNGSGLFYLKPNATEFTSLHAVTKKDYITKTAYISSILEDSNNRLWVATLFGLYELQIENDNSYNFKWYSAKAGNFPSNDIITLHEDVNRNVWVGTGDNGLAMLPSSRAAFSSLEKPDNLFRKSIRALLSDAGANLWISTNSGVGKYNPTTKLFRNYTSDDGLPSNEFNGAVCLKARNGKFYFGSDKGVLAFFPDSIRDNTTEPTVYLTDLKIDNESVKVDDPESVLNRHISLTDKIELSYNQRSFIINFAAINYGKSAKSQYCYRLEGFDQNWNCVGSNQSATYTNIDPGHYVFLVRATSSDGISGNKQARLEITIHQAPWKTWWAIVLYGVLFLSLVFFIVKIRVERIHIKNLLELERLAHEKDQALGESKTLFFTNVSHEFRTPLSLIAMPLESLSTMNDLPPSVTEKLNAIRVNAEKMLRLVNELMDFNKLEEGKLKLHIQHGELDQFIIALAAVFKPLAEKKNIRFGVDCMVPSLEGWFDHNKLEKIVVNILYNAFKFTSDGGAIKVTINAKDSTDGQLPTRYVEIAIADNGIGISPEELPFIFDKFYQTKSATRSSNPGTGIGLSLTKGLVEFHGGSITAESTPDHETKFVIVLPISRHVYNDDDIDEGSADQVSEKTVNHTGTDGLANDDGDNKPQILIVEDNDELRKYISHELKQQFNVLEASDGNEGLAIALEKSPDLIISDILMPVKSGIEFCREIKEDLKTSHIPFVLLTAKATVDDQIAGVATGADVYITKPFSIRFLIAQVNQIIDSRQKLYSRFSQEVYLLPGKMTSNDIDQAFLQKAIDYIIAHLQDPQLGVDSIADLFNLSRMQVYRKIKALTGKSVVDFIRMVRIKEALKLMETQRYTLSEIAFQTGFNSASYFTRCFKDHYGKAPSEYLEVKK